MEDQAITLNVGGVSYQTSANVLWKADPNSILYKLKDQSAIMTLRDDTRVKILSQNTFFFDRDGMLFNYVIGYIRGGPQCLPRNVRELDLVDAEAIFYEQHELRKSIAKIKLLLL